MYTVRVLERDEHEAATAAGATAAVLLLQLLLLLLLPPMPPVPPLLGWQLNQLLQHHLPQLLPPLLKWLLVQPLSPPPLVRKRLVRKRQQLVRQLRRLDVELGDGVRSIKDWRKGKFLGKGSFGTVHEGFTDAGFFFAVKKVSLRDQGRKGKQSIYNLKQEISLLSQFKHENIVQYLGTDQDNRYLYIFLELATKGSLANFYEKYKLWDSQVSAYTRQILNGLNYLHGRNVVHRDIKCANILVDASGSVKLADFGLAKATKGNDLKSFKGTAYWMAPEVVNRKNHGYGLAADIWSLGCTVLEMLTSKIPYSDLEPMQAVFRIGKGIPPLIPSSLSSEAQDFISKCLQVVPDDRPTAAQLLDHPFVNRPLSTISIP